MAGKKHDNKDDLLAAIVILVFGAGIGYFIGAAFPPGGGESEDPPKPPAPPVPPKTETT
jgi:hypothetical protein